MKRIALLTLILAGCFLPTWPEGDKPILVTDPRFAAICIDSTVVAPEGESCSGEAWAGLVIIIQNPNPVPDTVGS